MEELEIGGEGNPREVYLEKTSVLLAVGVRVKDCIDACDVMSTDALPGPAEAIGRSGLRAVSCSVPASTGRVRGWRLRLR